VVLLVVRPIIKRLFETAAGAAAPRLAAQTAGATAQLPAPDITAFSSENQNNASAESEIEKMIDISRVEGQVKASSLRKVGEVVDQHPEEAVSILRNWIYQENNR